jgi:hypothetical protein
VKKRGMKSLRMDTSRACALGMVELGDGLSSAWTFSTRRPIRIFAVEVPLALYPSYELRISRSKNRSKPPAYASSLGKYFSFLIV